MKKIAVFLFGLILIIFSNTLYNFIPFSLKPNLVLLYVIIISLYSDMNPYVQSFILCVMGLILDASIGRYLGYNMLVFLLISLGGIYFSDKIRKDTVYVPTVICTLFIVVVSLLNTVISSTGGLWYHMQGMILTNLIFILINAISSMILIFIINKINARNRRYR